MKKSGFTLIETVVSLGIIMILIQVSTSLLVQSSKAFKFRETEEETQRIIYCIMQELKYNCSTDELVRKSKDGRIDLKLQKDFLTRLITTPLLSFEEGNGINIKLNDFMNDNCLEISIKLINDNGDEIARKTFIKSRWMESEK